MAKITRVTAQLFGVSAGATGISEFAAKEVGGALVYSTDPDDLQTASWSLGWTVAQYQGVFAPYYQDRNAVDYVIFYQLAYLLQNGFGEWNSTTTYYLHSVVQYGGSIYISLVDSNLNNTPPAGASNAFWQRTAFPNAHQAKSPTRTVLTTGSGTYVPPTGCTQIRVRAVGGGGGGGSADNTVRYGTAGGATTFGSISCGGGAGGQGSQNGQSTPPGVGVGGAGGVATGGDVNIPGGVGGTGINDYPTVNKNGRGGASRFACVPAVDFNGSLAYILPGASAPANTGAGGTGAYFNENYYGLGWAYPGGGGAGAYAEKTIVSPAASYSYSVGAGGAGATSAGGASYYGGNGGSGLIIVDEYYY
ncbi:MAG: hypothetical protein PHS14_00180 [Elusimicrobia bacterium]|nr:hypothetical protein [Elusimicrobiota bacterium]